jgi:cell division protein FtsB
MGANGSRRRLLTHRRDIAWPPRAGIWYRAALARTTLYTRTLVLATAALCGALLFATGSQALVNHRLAGQVSAAQADNARLRADIAATNRRLAWASAPATIEAAARVRGYLRPGERAMVIVPAPTDPRATAPNARPDPASDWWRILFGG